MLSKFTDLILEAAVNQIAVDDFDEISEEYSPEENTKALKEFQRTNNTSLLEVIDYVLEHGQTVRSQILANQARLIFNK